MADQLQLRGGTTSQTNSFTGANKEVTVDTNKKTLVIHDGATVGGFSLSGVAQPDGSIHFDNRNGVERMRLTADGKLGIGTVDPKGRLSVQVGGQNFYIDGLGQPNITINTTGGWRRGIIFKEDGSNNGASVLAEGTGTFGGTFLRFATDVDFNTDDGTGVSGEKMRLTSDGALLVGTTVIPSNHKASIQGSLRLNHGTDLFDFSEISFGVGRVKNAASIRSSRTDVNRQGNEGDLRFHTFEGTVGGQTAVDAPERMRLTSTGYLKADPAGSYLNVAGGSLVNRPIHSVASGVNDVTFAVINSSTTFNTNSIVSELTSSANGNHIRAATGNSSVFTVKANGDVFSATNQYTSDIKLKENIEDASPKLEDINKIRFVNYNFKEGPRKDIREFGVIAQELEEIFPALVESTPDTEEVEVTKTETFETSEPVLDEKGDPVLDENGDPVTTTKTEEREVTTTETRETGEVTKSVKYSVLTLMAVKALQEADAKINAQQSIIDDLLARVEALENA